MRCETSRCLQRFSNGGEKAQNARGFILGHVPHPSGAVVPNAKATLRNAATAITYTFATTGSGDFVFVNLIPGNCELTVVGTGFKTAVSGGLLLQVGQRLRQDFTLQLGSTAMSVTVSAQAQMIQADSVTVGQAVGEKFPGELPLNGRDFTSLIAISLGVTQASGGIQTSVFDQHGLNDNFPMVSVDGARPASIGGSS